MPTFKSGLEETFYKKTKGKYEYEPDTIPFIQPAAKRKYRPDFKIRENVYVETKGRLDSSTRAKHLWVKEQNPDITIYFVFQRPHNRIRKGSKTTYASWCEEHGFEWAAIDGPFPKHWFK